MCRAVATADGPATTICCYGGFMFCIAVVMLKDNAGLFARIDSTDGVDKLPTPPMSKIV
jgi:hypothetical protein